MAAKILPIVKNQHLLLCTLLIGNALAMEVLILLATWILKLVNLSTIGLKVWILSLISKALPIFLDALLPAWASILISVTLILAFGEVKSWQLKIVFYNLFMVETFDIFLFFVVRLSLKLCVLGMDWLLVQNCLLWFGWSLLFSFLYLIPLVR